MLFVVGETATPQSMLRQNIRSFSCPVFPAARVPITGPVDLGERKIWDYQAEQPDASAWRLILLAAGR